MPFLCCAFFLAGTVDIVTIDDRKFEFDRCLHFFMDFQYATFKDFFYLQIALTRSIFELEKFSFFQID